MLQRISMKALVWSVFVVNFLFNKESAAFTPQATSSITGRHLNRPFKHPETAFTGSAPSNNQKSASSTSLNVQDLSVIGLVAGQENYGLAVVCIGEALWSFLQAPSFSHAKVLVPAAIAAVVLVALSGPMITSGEASSVGTGLWIATGVSVGLGASYVARLLAPFSPSPKEIAALGLLVAVAGFFSFSQNLIVDGFVALPSLPAIELPEINL